MIMSKDQYDLEGNQPEIATGTFANALLLISIW